MAVNVFLGDAVGGDVLDLHLRGQGAKGVDHLRPAAVVEGQGEGGSGVAGGGVGGPGHLVLNFWRQLVGAPDVADADVVVHHALQVALQVAPEQAHEEADLGAGAAKIVFQRKSIEGEPGQADARGRLSNQLDALGALLMAEEPLQRAMAGPASVSIHDDGHVLRQALGLQGCIDGALLSSEFMDAQGAG
jgi:hypothetical protein